MQTATTNLAAVTPYRPIGARLASATAFLAPLLVASVLLATSLGPTRIPYAASAAILLERVGLRLHIPYTDLQQRIIMQVRLPRVLTGALVGAALALSGAALQGLFRNPVADPGVLGVSSGGAAGAVAAIALNLQALHPLVLAAAAFVGAMVAVTLVYATAAAGGRFSLAALLLAGLAVSSFLGAVTSTIIYFSARDAEVLREIFFWLLGGLDARSWSHVRLAAPPILLGAVVLLAFGRDLNLLLLGEEQARSLGVSVAWARRILLVTTALITGVAVAVSGTIGFVGLIVPHVLRLVVGPDHRVLLPAAALGGAIFLILADTVARVALAPTEMRLGIITAFLGAPFFLFLLIRAQRQGALP